MFDELIKEEKEEQVTDITSGNFTFPEIKEFYSNEVKKEMLRLHNDRSINLTDMDTRFSTALNKRNMQDKVVVLVGVGGIGNWVWRVLVSMGIETLILVDFDTVGIENIGPQAHNLVDIGEYKVDAAAAAITQLRGINVKTIKTKVEDAYDLIEKCGGRIDILITAVDNMSVRRELRVVQCELLIDLRMSLGDWTAYCIPKKYIRSNYYIEKVVAEVYSRNQEAFFDDENAVQEACTERAIVYTGANIASYVGAYLHWYFNIGYAKLTNIDTYEHAYREYYSGLMEFGHMMSFSSRDWEFITPTKKDIRVKEQIAKLKAEIEALEALVEVPVAIEQPVEEIEVTVDEELVPGDVNALDVDDSFACIDNGLKTWYTVHSTEATYIIVVNHQDIDRLVRMTKRSLQGEIYVRA